MPHSEAHIPDYGTGQKTLGIYVIGLVICVVLTLFSFLVVMSQQFEKWEVFVLIYTSAIIQFIVQLICFLRLNLQTQQGRTNVMSLVFTGVIMMCIIIGSLWIMYNLDYNMVN